MLNFIEDKINHYANVILTGGDKRDSHALGELAFAAMEGRLDCP